MQHHESFFYTYRHALISGFLMIVAIIICLAVATHFLREGKVGTTFSIVPDSATLTINGQPSAKGTLWLQPGSYDITVSQPGFERRQRQVIVSPDKQQNVVAISLAAQSDEAKRWAERHSADYTNNEQFGAIEARETGQYLRRKHPIINVLPYTDPYYKIAYVIEDGQDLVLTVSTPSPRYRYFAVQKIRELGYDPTDYRVEFRDFTNPLAKGEAQ